MASIVNNRTLECNKCLGRMLVDRVFLSEQYLEIYCLVCGKREIFNKPESSGDIPKWIMRAEKSRLKMTGNSL
jgi:hypothetical protein